MTSALRLVAPSLLGGQLLTRTLVSSEVVLELSGMGSTSFSRSTGATVRASS